MSCPKFSMHAQGGAPESRQNIQLRHPSNPHASKVSRRVELMTTALKTVRCVTTKNPRERLVVMTAGAQKHGSGERMRDGKRNGSISANKCVYAKIARAAFKDLRTASTCYEGSFATSQQYSARRACACTPCPQAPGPKAYNETSCASR